MKIIKLKKGNPYLFSDVRLWGGKGDNLLRLAQVCNVPEGFVISSDTAQEFIKQADLEKIIDPYMKNPSEERFRDLKQNFISAPIQKGLMDVIVKELPLIGSAVSVRSSERNEDSDDNSFAGQRDTVLGMETPEEVAQAYKEVVASLYTPRSILYTKTKGLEPSKVIAVVVHRLVKADFGGVAYSPSPNNADEIQIESAWGLPTTVVDGKPCDIFRVSNSITEDIVSDISPKKNEMEVYDPKSRKVIIKNVEKKLRGFPSLLEYHVKDVAREVKYIERAYELPMDMEFAYENGVLYVLQSRPITTINRQEKIVALPNIPVNNILVRSKNTRNQGQFKGPVIVVKSIDHVNHQFNVDGDLIELDKKFRDGYILVTPEIPPQLEQYLTNARAIHATECGTTGHAAAVADEKGILYLGRGTSVVPNLLDVLQSGMNLGIAASKDQGIVFSL